MTIQRTPLAAMLLSLAMTMLVASIAIATSYANAADRPRVSLVASLKPSPIKLLSDGSLVISGEVDRVVDCSIHIRVTTSIGTTHFANATARGGQFQCRFPDDFSDAAELRVGLLCVDATDQPQFDDSEIEHQAEITLIVHDSGPGLPDLPMVFTDDFIDGDGRKDKDAAQWSRQRVLVNRFLHSRAAMLMRIRKPRFDLEADQDFAWFQQNATLYDFDHRDRDWSQPLGHRVARGYWQAVWNTWFNASNDHPWDGNANNREQSNYRPYTFANDLADILVLYRMLQQATPVVHDNRRTLADEALLNLIAMQHRTVDNFALPESKGRQEHYTAGAFRYGVFESGEWLTEGKGWFTNPAFRDFAHGGVFNGRAVWALGESFKAEPHGPHANAICQSIELALRFCLNDGIEHGYTYRTKSGLPIWSRIAGEHAYLLLGMLAAAEVMPELPIQLDAASPARPLRLVAVDALNALAESVGPDGNWTHYGNATAMNIAALAEGARVFASESNAPIWKATAIKAADSWLAMDAAPERSEPTPMIGHRTNEGRMTFRLGNDKQSRVTLYIGGHWLHALAVLQKVAPESRYLERAHAIVGYYCGDNPMRVRLLNEIGAVNNQIIDTDSDGVEDTMSWDGYPESTAFFQIGLLHLLR